MISSARIGLVPDNLARRFQGFFAGGSVLLNIFPYVLFKLSDAVLDVVPVRGVKVLHLANPNGERAGPVSQLDSGGRSSPLSQPLSPDRYPENPLRLIARWLTGRRKLSTKPEYKLMPMNDGVENRPAYESASGNYCRLQPLLVDRHDEIGERGLRKDAVMSGNNEDGLDTDNRYKTEQNLAEKVHRKNPTIA